MRRLALFVAVWCCAPSWAAAELVQKPSNSRILSFFEATSSGFAGNTRGFSEFVSVQSLATVDETAPSIVFDYLNVVVGAQSASFGGPVTPPGTLTPINISIALDIDPFVIALPQTPALALTNTYGPFFAVESVPLASLNPAVVRVTGTYRITSPDGVETSPFAVEMAPTGTFPGGGVMDFSKFPISFRFTGETSSGGGADTFHYVVIGDSRIVDTTIRGVPLTFDLREWSAGLRNLVFIPTPASGSLALLGCALGACRRRRNGRVPS